jgi:KaiC/GvpD/RAD55 family RecA-like ATPase
LLEAEIPRNSVILVTGAEGTLKSGLIFNMMSNHLAVDGGQGLYITLEQNKESHLKNMSSLGITKGNELHIFDYRDIRKEWMDRELDWIKMTEEVIDFYKDKYDDLTLFALDSLNVLYSFSEDVSLRKRVYHFFSKLKEEDLISFMIMEAAPLHVFGPAYNGIQPYYLDRFEQFLADGTIELGIMEGMGGVKRYIQIHKMRFMKHAMEKHQITVGENGIKILGPIY